jgi:small-conductance mechanosensitive channel
MRVAERSPTCLREPKPILIFQGSGESSLSEQFSVRAARENYLELRNSMAEQINDVFDEVGIEIPLPCRTPYAGSVAEPPPRRTFNEIRSEKP